MPKTTDLAIGLPVTDEDEHAIYIDTPDSDSATIGRCPVCGSQECTFHSRDWMDDTYLWQTGYCSKCGAEWDHIWRHVEIVIKKEPTT